MKGFSSRCYTFFLTFFIALASSLNSQTDSLKNYSLSSGISPAKQNWEIATELSYIGEYTAMLARWDLSANKPGPLSSADSLYFKKFRAIDALAAMDTISKKEKIVIINEAHHQPYHRVFTTSLLKKLFDNGYRYFCAETLGYSDTLLNPRKYPVEHSGYYTKEPLYSNLIRSALETGFTVFSYETQRTTSDSAGINLRETDQAKNIKAILDKDPGARILIHCGYDHLVESDYPGWGKAMAGRLTEYTGINPFTIDQVTFTERSSPAYENPFFKDCDLGYYAFFADSSGRLFNGPKQFNRYDARLYHPRTRWLHGRPHWQFENGKNAVYVNDKISIAYPCLVLAYVAAEKDGNPFDIIELNSKEDKKALALKKGRYKVVIHNAAQEKQIITIKNR